MANLYNQRGHKIRLGASGIRKVLMSPDKITDAQKEPDYAMVWNDIDGKEVYISRSGPGQRSCEFNVTWWEGDEQKSQDFQFKDRDKAIELFMRLVR